MGLGLYIASEIPRKGIFRKPLDKTALFNDLTDAFSEMLPMHIRKYVFHRSIDNKKLTMQLHPSEEPVEFQLKDGVIICSAKTNSAGPGYHKFLVESLEFVEKRLRLKWNWSEDEYGDETHYHENRNFKSLQKEMLKWLRALSRTLIKQEDKYSNIMISMPLGYLVIDNHFAASPLGFWEKKWFEQVANLEIEELQEFGQAFFPWWDEGFGAEFWLKCGLTKAWLDLPWHIARNEEEEKDYLFVLRCFDKAYKKDNRITLPEKEIGEIKNFLDTDDFQLAPRKEGIGYRRRKMRRKLTGYWSVEIPGYYYDDLENDGSTALYWFGDKTIRGSSVSLGKKEGGYAQIDSLINEIALNTDSLYFEKDYLKAWAKIEEAEENGDKYFCMQGAVRTSNSVCFVTICFENIHDRDWAIETWKTVRMPKPKVEQKS